MERLTYPLAPTSDETADHFGQTIGDPFRPLESFDDPTVKEWVAAQNILTESFISTFSDDRDKIRARITDLWDYPKSGLPSERGGVWFQSRNTGLQNQAVLYVGDSLESIDRVLIDPNTLSGDGTVSLTGLGIRQDGGLIAYATSCGGSDWMTWNVRNVATGEDLPDVIEWSKFSSAAWTKDGAGFFYEAPEPPEPGSEYVGQTRGDRVMFHVLGEDQSLDKVIFTPPDPTWIPMADVSDDGRYLIVINQRGTDSATHVLIAGLSGSSVGDLKPLTAPFEAKVLVVANRGEDFYLLSDLDADRGRVLKARLGQPSTDWTEVVPGSASALTEVHHCGGYLICHYLDNACSALRIFDLDGTPVRDVPLPGIVSLQPGGRGLVEGNPNSSIVFYKAVSFVESGSIWSYDLGTGDSCVIEASTAAIDPARFDTEQVWAPSADGTPIPMFLTHAAGATPAGDARVLLYGYGGFDIPLTPTFSVAWAAWLENGGVLAVANLRGGGEFGRTWHEAGRLANKQNVFDDFSGCARWLAASRWSRPERIAISGGSNGGLLVGACLTQHPDLFGAAVADVGVFDMLRFHLWTIGWAWKSDYGDPEDPEQFGWLRAYSPLHNVRQGRCYPPTLIMTGDHDDRVVPSHSFKFAATLQQAQGCTSPILLRVETSAGHGVGKPTDKLIAEATDRLAFLGSALK